MEWWLSVGIVVGVTSGLLGARLELGPIGAMTVAAAAYGGVVVLLAG